MKKLIPALFAAIAIISCNEKDHGDANLHIAGKIKGFNQGTIYIKKIVDTSFVALDTIVIKGNSDFESHLKIDSPEMLYLFLDRGVTTSVDDNLPFFAEPGQMTITTSNEEFFNPAKITGSKNHKLYEDYLKIKSRFTGQNLELVQKNMEATKNSQVERLDSISTAIKRLQDKRYLYTVNFVLNNKDFEVAPYLTLAEIPDINMKYLDTIHKNLSPKVAQSHYGKILTKFVEERKKHDSDIAKQ